MALATLRMRTTILPDVETDLEAESSPGPSSWIVRLLRPAFTVETPLGSWTRAPWGDPGETSWPLGAALVVLVIGALALVAVRLIRRSR